MGNLRHIHAGFGNFADTTWVLNSTRHDANIATQSENSKYSFDYYRKYYEARNIVHNITIRELFTIFIFIFAF